MSLACIKGQRPFPCFSGSIFDLPFPTENTPHLRPLRDRLFQRGSGHSAPSTHFLTHDRKIFIGQDRSHSPNPPSDLLILGRKRPKPLSQPLIFVLPNICNQQVGGSNPSTSSTIF